MSKLFLSLLLTMAIASGRPANAPAIRPASDVYVCDSKTSVAYHADKDCRGLNRCTHTIIKISQTDAINKYGKRKCKICY